MRTSKEITAELAAIEKRRAQVEQEYSAAKAAADAVVRAIALGDAPIGELTEKNQSLQSWRAVKNELEGKRAALEVELQAATEHQQREAFLSQAEEIRQTGNDAWREYLTAYQTAMREYSALAGKIIAAEEIHAESRRLLKRLCQSKNTDPRAILSELEARFGDAIGVRQIPLGSAGESFTCAQSTKMFEGPAQDALFRQLRRERMEYFNQQQQAQTEGLQ